MSHPNDDAKHLLKGGIVKAIRDARSNLIAADSGDDEMAQVHALLVFTYIQGYANGKGFGAFMTPDQYVRMQLDAHTFEEVLADTQIKRFHANSAEEYDFYGHSVTILEGILNEQS